MATQDDDKASFHEIAIVYDRFAREASESGRSPCPHKRTDFDWLSDKLSAYSNEKPLLDVGCGSETIAAQLALDDGRLIGIDLSEEMIGLARKKHPQHAFYVMNAQSLRFPDDSIGGAVAYFSLIHLSEIQLGRVLVELNRVLGPKAPLLMTLYGEQSTSETTPSNQPKLSIHSYHEERVQEIIGALDCFTEINVTRRAPHEIEPPYEHLFIETTTRP